MDNLVGRDTGEEIIIDAAGVGGLTVAALANRLGSDEEVVFATGLNAAGDGGGGVFMFVEGSVAAAYSGMVIAATNGRYFRVTDNSQLNIRWFGGIPETWANGVATGPSYVNCKLAYDAAYAWAMRDVTLADDAVVEILFPSCSHAYELSSSLEPPAGNHRMVSLIGGAWMTSSPATYGQDYWLAKNVSAGGTYNPVGLGSCLRWPSGTHGVLMGNDGSAGAGYRKFSARDIAFCGAGAGVGVAQRATAVGDHGCGLIRLENVFFGGWETGLEMLNAEASTYRRITARGCYHGISTGYFSADYTMGQACWSQQLYEVDLQYNHYNVRWRKAITTHIWSGLIQAALIAHFRFDDVLLETAQGCSVNGVHFETAPSLFVCGTDNTGTYLTFDKCNFRTEGDVAGRTLRGGTWCFTRCTGIDGFEWRGGPESIIVFNKCGTPSAINGLTGGTFLGQVYVDDPARQANRSLTTGGAWAPSNFVNGRNISLTTNADLTVGDPSVYSTGDEIDLEVILGGEHTVRFDLTYFNPTASLNDDAWSLPGARGVFKLRRRAAPPTGKWQVSEWSGWGGVVKLATGIVAGLNAQGSVNLAAEKNVVATVASANDAVTMPEASPGARCVVINNGANSMNLYPASGDNLGAGVNTAVAVPAGTNVDFIAYDRTNWEAMP